MRGTKLALMACLVGLSGMSAPVGAMPQQEEASVTSNESEWAQAEAVLQELATDYMHDPMAIDATFGIKLGEMWWTVAVTQKETPSQRGRLTDHTFGPHDVALTRGQPAEPTWYFEIADQKVLDLIGTGQVNAGTAAMQSFGSDKVGVETRDMDGFQSTSGDEGDMYIALSHFFTKGKPEVTRFGLGNSLETHGAQATALHMMKGFRVVYATIGVNEVVNEDPRLEFGQMPNLFIVTRGKGTLNTDDGPMVLEKGMSVFVPQYVKHQIVNDGDEPLEAVVVLYGDNSDFAFGTSYPEYLKDLNEFNRNYEFRKTQLEETEQ